MSETLFLSRARLETLTSERTTIGVMAKEIGPLANSEGTYVTA